MSSVDDYVVYCEVSIMYEKHFRHFGAVEVSNVFAYAILDRCADDITISDDMIHYSYADDRNRQYALFIFENDNEFVNIV